MGGGEHLQVVLLGSTKLQSLGLAYDATPIERRTPGVQIGKSHDDNCRTISGDTEKLRLTSLWQEQWRR